VATAVNYGSLPFKEQIAFFRQKLNVPTRAFTDVMGDAHDTSFMVAGAYKADLLTDLRGAVQDAAVDGGGLNQFRKDFDSIVERHGWSYKGGRNWRTRVIYETNMRASYMAGRYIQLTDPEALQTMPYWEYHHDPLVKEPRAEHLAWDGLVLPADDPWWDTHFPPNDYGCMCTVYPRSEHDLERMGKAAPDDAPPVRYVERTVGASGPSPRTVMVPEGIGPGWDYPPGKSVAQHVRELVTDKLATWPSDIGAGAFAGMADVLTPLIERDFSQWVDVLDAGRKAQREWKVISAMGTVEMEFLIARDRASQTAEIAIQDGLLIGSKQTRHVKAGDALTIAEWKTLPRGLSPSTETTVVLYDTEKENLLYVLPSIDDPRKIKIAVEPQFWMKKERQQINAIRSATKVSLNSIEGRIKGGQYIVVRGSFE
jgi:hypothetical protein